jgi:adenylate cyclase
LARRLAAILAADMVGLSRLMATDEAGTFARMKALRAEVIEPLISGHRGRVFKLTGDGILAEFARVVDAVACAVAWQHAMPDEALQCRIVINLGDIIDNEGDIYGNGVNVAVRPKEPLWTGFWTP